MGEVVPFPKGQVIGETNAVFQFSMDFSLNDKGEWSAVMVGPNPGSEEEKAAKLREYAEALENVSLKMHKKAEETNPGPRGEVVSTLVIYRDSSVKLVIDHNFVETHEQYEWLNRRFDDAKEAARLP